MQLEKPPRSHEWIRLRCQIDIWVEKELRFPAIDGNEHPHFDSQRFGA